MQFPIRIIQSNGCKLQSFACNLQPNGCNLSGNKGEIMAQILIGTSGYSYADWVGPVYPEGTKPGKYLPLYSEMFPTVELNFSYYKMPKARNLAKMLTDSGKTLTFSIKAYQSLTHDIKHNWTEDAKIYLEEIEPLQGSGRLEAVLFQFPYSFRYNDDNRIYLDKLLKYFRDVPVAVEFRKTDWYCEKVIEGMAKREVALAALDMPELPNLPQTLDLVTAPFAYVRLHGRNKGAWWGNNANERYNYLYTDSELGMVADKIKALSEKAKRLLIYLNNHYSGKAVRNGQTLEGVLKKMGIL